MKHKVVIIDDEILAVELLQDYCSKIESFDIISSFTDPIEAYNFLTKNEADLIFLDINMPELNGLDLAKVLPEKTKLIFATAYREFGVDAFELQALDYLLKPIAYPRFLKAVQRFLGEQQSSAISKIKNYIIIRSDRKDYKVFFHDILYVEGLKDYVKVITSNSTLLTKASIGLFMKNLPDSQFTRIHKSYIVSNQQLTAIGHEEVLIGKKRIPIGLTFREKAKQLFEKD